MSMDSFLSALRGVGKKAVGTAGDLGSQGVDLMGQGVDMAGNLASQGLDIGVEAKDFIKNHPIIRDLVSSGQATPEALDNAIQTIIQGIAQGQAAGSPPAVDGNQGNPYGLGTGVNPGMPPQEELGFIERVRKNFR